MKVLVVILVFAAACVAQSPCPLAVVKVNPARTRWSDGRPRDITVEVQNTSDKEEAVAQYLFTYTDKLGQITDTILGEPVFVHESGHKTLRPGKKATSWFDASILHPNDYVDATVVVVKFSDGTVWEAK